MHSFARTLVACLVAVAPSLLAAQGTPARTPLTIERITAGPPLAGAAPASPLWSPDSKVVAFLWSDAAHPDRSLWLVDRAGTAPRRLLPATSTGRVGEFVWTPDGSAIVFVQQDSLWRITLTTGARSALLSRIGDLSELAVSPNGTTVSFLRDGDLWLLPMAGGAPLRATNVAVAPLGTIARTTDATWKSAAPRGADRHRRMRGRPIPARLRCTTWTDAACRGSACRTTSATRCR